MQVIRVLTQCDLHVFSASLKDFHCDVYDKEGFRKVLQETYQEMDDLGEL